MYFELTDRADKSMLVYADGKFIPFKDANMKHLKICVLTNLRIMKNNPNCKTVNLEDVPVGFVEDSVWVEFISKAGDYRCGRLYDVLVDKYDNKVFCYSGEAIREDFAYTAPDDQYPVIIHKEYIKKINLWPEDILGRSNGLSTFNNQGA